MSADVVAFTIPGQPQGKGRAKIVRIGGYSRMATPAKTVAYEGLVSLAAGKAMGGRDLMEGPVAVALELECQVPASWSKRKQQQALLGEIRPTSKPDADNTAKAILDGCNGVLWRDDAQVVELSVRKRYHHTPCVRVRVWPVKCSTQQEITA
jgi:Holliday junction resolvase RusA-like endonuclease